MQSGINAAKLDTILKLSIYQYGSISAPFQEVVTSKKIAANFENLNETLT